MKNQESIKVLQHIPNFVDCGKPKEVEAKTLKELLEVKWIKDYTNSHFNGGDLLTFCRSDSYNSKTLLMVENDDGTAWWVVGTVLSGNIDQLPKAKMKKNT